MESNWKGNNVESLRYLWSLVDACLFYRYSVAPSYGYAHAAPIVTAKAYRAPLYASIAAPAITTGVYTAPHAGPVAIAGHPIGPATVRLGYH